MSFYERLQAQWDQGRVVCVGLDPVIERIPECVRASTEEGTLIGFNEQIIKSTADIAGVFKPNVAFYEKYGSAGWWALAETIACIRRHAPEAIVILDAKRADIGKSNKGYVIGGFELLGADAITVHPYLGGEALAPFLEDKSKGTIVLCRTSNPGAGEFQDLMTPEGPLYQVVARHVATRWNANNNCAVVAGATYPEELGEVRKVVGDMPILIPGIGTQGGDLEATVRAGISSKGIGMIINSSSGIIFASDGADFADAARQEAERLNAKILEAVEISR